VAPLNAPQGSYFRIAPETGANSINACTAVNDRERGVVPSLQIPSPLQTAISRSGLFIMPQELFIDADQFW
jgi:hypothetical protein